MKLIGEKKRGISRPRAGEVLVKPVIWDAVTEIRLNSGLIKDKIDQEVWAGFFLTAMSHGYMSSAVDEKYDFPNVGQEALKILKVRAEGLRQEYKTGVAYFQTDQLSRLDDLCFNAALMVALFPEFRFSEVETVHFAMETLLNTLELGLESKEAKTIKSVPHTLFDLLQLDSNNRAKGLTKSLEPVLMEQYCTSLEQPMTDPDKALEIIFNGMYLRLLFPERAAEIETVTQKALPVLKEFVQQQKQGLDAYLMTIYIALTEAHELSVDEHGQIHAKLREPLHQTRVGLPERGLVE